MSLLLTAALSSVLTAQGVTLPSCSWDRPGANAFKGDVVAAVDRYTDIPADVRARLKARMSKRQYDEIAVISRDSITGKAIYSAEIRDMHFAQATVCQSVTRSKWAANTIERGLVYCEADHCLIVPTVCRNVSRVTRLQKPASTTASQPGSAPDLGGDEPDGKKLALAAKPSAETPPLDLSELQFEAPGAGTSFTQLASASPSAPVGLGNGGSFGGDSGSGAPWLGGSGLPNIGGGAGGIGGGGGVESPSAPTETPGSVPPVDFPVIPPVINVPDLVPTSPVPEPGAALMMLMGLAGLAGIRHAGRRRRLKGQP